MEPSDRGIIFNIKRFAVHDGPGIRTAVFMKGCPLNCTWCHNPEGIDGQITVWYNRNQCIACGSCVDACPEKALALQTGNTGHYINIDRNMCTVSGRCVAVCPTGAIELNGREAGVDDIMTEILKDRRYYELSGGGVTLTGGEPLFQPEFALALLKRLKAVNIDTAIETSLQCERIVLENLIPFTDHFLADMKIYDPSIHEQYTGKKNRLIKDNLSFLISSGHDVTVRIPLIPVITDTPGNKKAIIEFVRSLNPAVPVEFLDYNYLTSSKYEKMGIVQADHKENC